MRRRFDAFATACAYWMGHPIAFVLALVSVLAWAACGPVFDYSDTWQLVINTSTTVLTFLGLFVIQSTQNRDNLALNAKVDELVIAVAGARNELAGIEAKSEDEISRMRR